MYSQRFKVLFEDGLSVNLQRFALPLGIWQDVALDDDRKSIVDGR